MEMLVNPVSLDYLTSADSPFQSAFWASVKVRNEWKPYAFSLEPELTDENKSGLYGKVLVLTRHIAAGFYLAYIPFGPEYAAGHADFTMELLAKLADSFGKYIPDRIFAVRFDLPWGSSWYGRIAGTGKNYDKGLLHGSSSVKKICELPYSIQPDATILVNLDRPIGEILSSFRKRAKRGIKRCMNIIYIEKIHIGGNDADSAGEHLFSQWYDTYLITAERDGFTPRSRAYMKHLLVTGSLIGNEGDQAVICDDIEEERGNTSADLFTAHLKGTGRVVGGIIVLKNSGHAVYLAGSSLRSGVIGCSPSYLLQWRAMEDAKLAGCHDYDLFGIPKEGAGTSHHLNGLSLFKNSFAGTYVSRPGTIDVVLKKYVYRFYAFMEKKRISRIRNNT